MSLFIREFILPNTQICDDLIEYHKNGDQYLGVSGTGYDPDIKESTDVVLEYSQEMIDFYSHLHSVVEQYKEIFPWCDKYASWGITEGVNIQHYKKGEGYKAWHTERSSCLPPFSTRHLTFLMYLNDVKDGGTEFLHQELIVDAVKGKIVIFPCDWTHTHRGVISNTQEKYIITGWFNFMN